MAQLAKAKFTRDETHLLQNFLEWRGYPEERAFAILNKVEDFLRACPSDGSFCLPERGGTTLVMQYDKLEFAVTETRSITQGDIRDRMKTNKEQEQRRLKKDVARKLARRNC